MATYQSDHDSISLPDFATESTEFFEGNEEQSPLIDDAEAQRKQLERMQLLTQEHLARNNGSASHALPAASAPPAETDCLLAPPASVLSVLGSRPGRDEQGEFEVYLPSVHVAGRHYHIDLHVKGARGEASYKPCPPCVTMNTPHQSTETYRWEGWLLAICCFPCGLLCCCFMTKHHCARCGAKLDG